MAQARSQRHVSTSPKRKARRRADCDEGGVGSKRPRNAPEDEDSLSQVMDDASGRRRSGRSGAGSGGRVLQLEKIGSALGLQSKKSRKATDLPDDAVENPCAPEKAQKGRRGRKDDLPPPLFRSSLPVGTTTMTIPAPAPAFHHRASDTDRFGFYAPPPTICSSGELADQPLPRPRPEYVVTGVAAGAQPSVYPVASRTRAGTLDDESRNSEPPYSNPAPFRGVRREISDHQIDPALLPPASQTYDVPGLRSQRVNRDYSDCETRDGDDEEESGNEEEDAADGWGTTHRQQIPHTGFTQDHYPQRPRHNSLPAEPEFEHSRDEAEDAAMEVLRQPTESVLVAHGNNVNLHREQSNAQSPQALRESSNTRSSRVPVTTRGDTVDVLNHHHQTNGRPSAPDPVRLLSRRDTNEVGNRSVPPNEIPVQTTVVEPRPRAPRNSKKSKDDPVSPDTLAFYPPVWKDFLEDAKRDCRIAHMLQNPFPSKSRDLKGSVTDSLLASVAEWTERGTKFEPGYWPENKTDMASLLLADISTWRSELKTVVLEVAPTAYGLNAPSNLPTPDRVQSIKSRATTLLSGSLFLRDGLDENGKTKNFAHPALQQATMEFFYLGSYRIADKRPDLFRDTIPIPCLALVAAACNCTLDGFAQNGSSKAMPHFSGKAYSSIYRGLLSIVNEVLQHPYHGPRLEERLAVWAEDAWASLQQVDKTVQRHDHLRAVLD